MHRYRVSVDSRVFIGAGRIFKRAYLVIFCMRRGMSVCRVFVHKFLQGFRFAGIESCRAMYEYWGIDEYQISVCAGVYNVIC